MIGNPMNPPLTGGIEWGTVGWVDDGGTYYELGSGDNDGKTLVRVTLFRGRAPDAPLDQSQAQGHKLLCQISGGLFRIPQRGTRVMVAIPNTYGEIPGASMIIGTSEPNGSQFAQSRVVIDVGPDTHLLLKGKSVSLQSYSQPAQFISVGVPFTGGTAGVYALDETGSGFSSQAGECALFACSSGSVTSTCHLTDSAAELLNNSSQTCGFQAKSGNANALGTAFNATCAGVYLGNPSTITPVLSACMAVGSGPPAFAPSTTVWISA